MKKKCKWECFPPGSISKILLRMKLLTFFIFVSMVTATASSYSQQTKFNLKLSGVTVRQVFQEIEANSEFILLYNEKQLDANRKVNVDVNDKTVESILDQIFAGSNNTFKIYDRQIVVLATESKDSPTTIKSNINSEQKKELSGTVRDSKGLTLPGVSVIVKGTTLGIVTDSDGKFVLAVPSDSKFLVFSFVGMKSQEFAITEKTTINLVMMDEAFGIEEVVVLGYGSLKRKEVTGSVSSVKMKDLPQTGSATVAQLLSGRAAGLTTTLASAQPGGRVNLQIRGTATGRSPLIVIDGFPVSGFTNGTVGVYSGGDTDAVLSSINPNDIETIDVLKDASATSIYGSKAAGGVILITTKRGKSGKVAVEFNGNVGVSQAYALPEMMNATQFMTEKNRENKEKFLYNNQIAPYGVKKWEDVSGYKPVYVDSDFSKWENNRGTEWDKEVMRTAMIQNYGVNFRGGDQSTQYFASFGYYDQEGIVKNNNYKKITGQINIDQKLGKKVNLGITMNLNRTYMDNVPLQAGYAEESDLLRSAFLSPPNMEVRDANGKYNLNPFAPYLSNPVSLLDIINQTKNDRIIANGFLTYEILSGLQLKGMLGTDIMMSQGYGYLPITTVMGSRVNGRADERLDDKNDYQAQLFLKYNKVLNEKHVISAMIGTEYIKTSQHGFRATNTDFISDSFLWYNLGIGAGYPSVGSYGSKSETIGYIGRLNYAYDERYFLTANLRIDGSSNFAQNHQWGYFPGISVGWDIAQESFMKNISQTLDQFKLRVGYGQTGNDNIGTAFANYYIPGDKTMYGNIVNSSIALGSLGNPDLKWETQTDLNAGVDFSLFNGKLGGSVEYFNRVISDLLGWKPLSSGSEITGISANMDSKKQTYGYEASLNSQNFKTNTFTWNTSFTFTYYRDRWLKRDDSWRPDINSTEKQYFGELWYHLTDGIVQPGETLSYTNKPIPGTVKLKDIDGYLKDDKGAIVLDENRIPKRTGAPDGKLDNADLVKIGINTPFSLGFTNQFRYKKFDLGVTFYGMFNRWKTNSTRQLLTDSYWMKDGLNQSTEVQNRWNSDNMSGYLPSSLQGQSSFGVGNYYLEKAWFIRLSNIDLGYTMSLKRAGIRNLRVFVAMQNPFIITSYKGMDPETDVREASYPNQRNCQIGLNLKF